FAGRLGTLPSLQEIAEAVRAAPALPAAPRPIDLLLDGVAHRFTHPIPVASASMRVALEAFRRPADADVADCARWFWLAWMVAAGVWDDEMQEELAARAAPSSQGD